MQDDSSELLENEAFTPAIFQESLTAPLERLIREGISQVPAPKSIRELSTLVNLYRQVTGLDAKAQAQAVAGLASYLRPAGRRMIDAEEVGGAALPAPAPAPAPAESWEDISDDMV